MKKLLFIAVMLCLSASLSAEQKKDWGRVSASLESTHHVYVDDLANNFLPTSGFDSNLSYLNGSRYASNNAQIQRRLQLPTVQFRFRDVEMQGLFRHNGYQLFCQDIY